MLAAGGRRVLLIAALLTLSASGMPSDPLQGSAAAAAPTVPPCVVAPSTCFVPGTTVPMTVPRTPRGRRLDADGSVDTADAGAGAPGDGVPVRFGAPAAQHAAAQHAAAQQRGYASIDFDISLPTTRGASSPES